MSEPLSPNQAQSYKQPSPITTTNGQRSAFKPLVWLVGVVGIVRYTLAGVTLGSFTVPAFDVAGYVGLMGAISALYCSRHVTKSWERIKTSQTKNQQSVGN